jgi:hypothetical protein
VCAGLLLVLGLVWGWSKVERPGLMEERRFGDYQVRVYRDEGGVGWSSWIRARLPEPVRRRLPDLEAGSIAAVEVRKGGRLVYGNRGALFHLPDSEWGWWDRRQRGVTPGRDVTGNGEPNLVIYEWSGKMREPVVVHVFEAGTRFRRLAELKGYDPRFEDVTGDGIPELVLIDGLFRFDPIYGSPSARVILRWSGSGYRVAGDLMKRPEPEPEEWQELVGRYRASDEWGGSGGSDDLPQRMFGEALRWMYGGQEEWGWRLLREGWTPGRAVDESLFERFRAQRDGSRYWQELAGIQR